MDNVIYLDYNATSPVDPRVVELMIPYLHDRPGNPSSNHCYGREALEAVTAARRQVSRLINADPSEVVFTAGGSETDNLAIKGVLFRHLEKRPHVVTTSVEHPAILSTLRYMSTRFDVDVTVVPVDGHCLVDPDDIERSLRPNTVLVSVMHANNEVGTVQPVEDIAAITRSHGIVFHVDAAQSAGKLPIDVRQMSVDLLTIASHKLYGPKGVGALFARRGVEMDALIQGSGQESGRRAGTENVPAIVGLGAASALAEESLPNEVARLRGLRDTLQRRLSDLIPGTLLNGHPDRRLPNTLNVSFPRVVGGEVLAYTPEIAASTGSACHSGSFDPSSVLLAMGCEVERALGAVRLSLGRWTDEEDVEGAARALAAGYQTALNMRMGVSASG